MRKEIAQIKEEMARERSPIVVELQHRKQTVDTPTKSPQHIWGLKTEDALHKMWKSGLQSDRESIQVLPQLAHHHHLYPTTYSRAGPARNI